MNKTPRFLTPLPLDVPHSHTQTLDSQNRNKDHKLTTALPTSSQISIVYGGGT